MNGLLAVAPHRSLTDALNDAETAAVAVPVSTPVLEFKANPAGNVPGVSAQVNGAVPPLFANVALYGVPTIPLASGDAEVIAGAALQCTVSGPAAETWAVGKELSVTLSITVVDAAVQVPTI